MRAKAIFPLLGLLGLGMTAPLAEMSLSTPHFNKLSKRDDFAEWMAGDDWVLTDAGKVFAEFDNGVKYVLRSYPVPSLSPSRIIVVTSTSLTDNLAEGDGNFVIYDANWKPLWASNTAQYSCRSDDDNGPGNCTLAFQGDGNFVLYVDGVPKWATNTDNKGATLLFQDFKPFIVIYNSAGRVVFKTPGTARVPDPQEPGGAQGGSGGGLGTLCREVLCVVV